MSLLNSWREKGPQPQAKVDGRNHVILLTMSYLPWRRCRCPSLALALCLAARAGPDVAVAGIRDPGVEGMPRLRVLATGRVKVVSTA